MNHRIYFLLFLLLSPIAGFSQITQQQARSIDSALVSEYLEYGNFHTTNYHDLPTGGVFTWDAGNGLNTTIEEYSKTK